MEDPEGRNGRKDGGVPVEVTRLVKRNHYEEITKQLRSLIAGGKLKPGDKLPSTKELSERFGVGRSTTREALSALKAMGLIEIRQGGVSRVLAVEPIGAGAAVELPELQALRVNRQTLLELLEVRLSLEATGSALAAERATADDLAELQQLVVEMSAAIGSDEEGERTDLAFHLALARASHNAILLQLFESIMEPLGTAIRDVRRVELYANRDVSQRLYEEHAAIVAAVAARDAEAAGTSMKRHLTHVRSMIEKYV